MKLRPLRFLTILVFCAFLAPAAMAQDARQHPRIITVTGTAEMKIAPDQAILTFGVETTNQDIVVAREQNAARMKKVLSIAQQAGIESKDLQTSELFMRPSYSDEQVPRLLGYSVTETITMTLRDITKYESLMSSFLQAGVNRVEKIEFAVAEPRSYKDEVRLRAIRAAREKATAMAAELGQTIGKPWEIVEDEGFYSEFNSSAGAQHTISAEEASIASGRILIRASVRVSFQLE